jgi:hypothetical protein
MARPRGPIGVRDIEAEVGVDAWISKGLNRSVGMKPLTPGFSGLAVNFTNLPLLSRAPVQLTVVAPATPVE